MIKLSRTDILTLQAAGWQVLSHGPFPFLMLLTDEASYTQLAFYQEEGEYVLSDGRPAIQQEYWRGRLSSAAMVEQVTTPYRGNARATTPVGREIQDAPFYVGAFIERADRCYLIGPSSGWYQVQKVHDFYVVSSPEPGNDSGQVATPVGVYDSLRAVAQASNVADR